MRHTTRLTAPVLALILCGSIYAVSAEDANKGAEIANEVCSACHGEGGNSMVPTFPSLAGQHKSYLLKELQDYKSGKRVNEMMSPFAESLSDEDIVALANYFSAQQPAPGTVNQPELLERGRKLYFEGNPDKGVPSCDSCHEDEAEGDDESGYPRLAGQQVEYVVEQFRLYADNTRMNGKRVMRAIASRLSEEEVLALAEFLASKP